ncbi:FkbM family methyltransferase [Burkholderia stagnalis]
MSLYELTDARHGRFVYNTNDKFVGRSLAIYGEWSEAEISLFRQIVREGDTVIEAGANIGTHTVFLSRAVGASGKVLAFEASRHTHQLLCANMALNECLNVHAIQKAIGEANGSALFPLMDPAQPGNFGEASLRSASTAAATEEVAMQSIDALALERLDFIKADIEGHELALLVGAVEALRKFRPVVYLEIDCANGKPTGNRDELVNFLEPLGYAAFYYIAPMFNPANFRGVNEDHMGAISLDLVCVPVEKASMLGLTQAKAGDDAIHISPGSLTYNTLPWDHANFRRSP